MFNFAGFGVMSRKSMKIFTMETRLIPIILLSAFVFVLTPAGLSAQSQQPQKSMEEYAADAADKLGEQLDLDTWQIFYVDSTYQHDWTAMQAEMESMSKSKVENVDLYQQVQDKWLDKVDSTFKTFFTEDQWAAYLRAGAGKAQKARAKRKAKYEGTK